MQGIGRLGIEITPEKTYRNPKTGEPLVSPAHPIVKVFVSHALKDRFKNSDFKVTEDGE